MGTVKVTNIEPIADNGTLTIGNSGDTIALTSGAKTSGFGKIGQVQSTIYTTATTQSVGGNTDKSITGMNVTITPTSTSSKILLFGRAFIEASASNYWDGVFFFRRGTTKIGAGETAGSRNIGAAVQTINYYESDKSSTIDPISPLFHVDSPATISATTYHIGCNFRDASATLYINRTVQDSDASSHERGSSEIIAMEILD